MTYPQPLHAHEFIPPASNDLISPSCHPLFSHLLLRLYHLGRDILHLHQLLHEKDLAGYLRTMKMVDSLHTMVDAKRDERSLFF